jgi:hypothetical protein
MATREELLQAAERARLAGDTQAAEELMSAANAQTSTVEPQAQQPQISPEIASAIQRARADGNDAAVQELTAYAQSQVLTRPQGQQAETTGEYLANQAKLGLVSFPVFAQAAIDTFVTQPFSNLYASARGQAVPSPGGIGERFGRRYRELMGVAAPVVGGEADLQAPAGSGVITRIAGEAIRTAADPASYTGVGLLSKAGTVTQKAMSVGSRGTTAAVIGGAAEAGGEVGAATEKAITGEDTGTGRLIGSLGLAVPAAATGAIQREAFKAGANVFKQLKDKYSMVKENPAAATEAYAQGAAKRLLEEAAKEMGSRNLTTVIDDFQRIADTVGRDNFPLLVSLADNPVIRSQVTRLARTNPTFRQQVNDELSSLATTIDQRAYNIFGPRYAVPNVEGLSLGSLPNRIAAVDSKIEELASAYIPIAGKTDVGLAVQNLVKARESLAKAERSKAYDTLLANAKKAGVKLPDDGVRDIYNFVVRNNVRDIFGKGTPLDRQIMNVLAPQNGVFFPISFDQVDSLKRAINKYQRTVKDPAQQLRLQQLEEVVLEARERIPGKWSQQLIDLDRLYYEKVGIPFTGQGIKDIDAKKYADQVAPVIVRNRDALDDFINVAGQEGVEIARRAVLNEVYEKAFRDGVLNRGNLSQYMKTKGEVIDRIPGLRQQLSATMFDDSALKIQRKALNDAAAAFDKRVADNYLLQNPTLGPDYRSIVNGMLGNNTNVTKFFNNLKDLSPEAAKAIRNAARAEFVDIARNSPKGAFKFITDPKNKTVVDKLFGSGYRNALLDIGKLSDAVSKADVSALSSVVLREEMDVLSRVAPGLDVPYVASQLRDRISSAAQKAIRILSRVQVASAREATDRAIIDLLMDPDGVKKLANVANELDFTIKRPTDFKKVIGAVGEIMPLAVYTSATATANQPE